MVKKIIKGRHIFTRKAQAATEEDKQVVTDLIDTLRANREICVGMAANMIGVNKSIIAVAAGPFQFAMINPVITKRSGEYKTEEGCLSLEGVRPCVRYEEIEVDYLDSNFKQKFLCKPVTGGMDAAVNHMFEHGRIDLYDNRKRYAICSYYCELW